MPYPFKTRLVINRARAAAARLDVAGALETLATAPVPAAALVRVFAILGAVRDGSPWTVGRWVTLQTEFDELLETGPPLDSRVYVGTPREFYRNRAWRAGTRHWVAIQEGGLDDRSGTPRETLQPV